MIASSRPVVAIDHVNVLQVSFPAGRHEAEIDMPRSKRVPQMAISGMCLASVRDAVKRMIGADESEVGEPGEDASMAAARVAGFVEIRSAVQIAHDD